MSRKSSDFLAELLADATDDAATDAPSPAPAPKFRRSPLVDRATAIGRLASGEVRQITELRLDPERCRIWPGNGRLYAQLSQESCRDLIDSLIAEGGQRVPAVVRRVSGDPDHDYEVLAGTRRHWSISFLRRNSYPDMTFLVQVHDIDDEAAFRLADIENRARKDLSDLERARNYCEALTTHYGGVQARMAERLRISKGWLSKMLAVAALPDEVVGAFGNVADIQLKSGYDLALALADATSRKRVISEARLLSAEQARRRVQDLPALAAPHVQARLVRAAKSTKATHGPLIISHNGVRLLTIETISRHGLTMRLHAGSGADEEHILRAIRDALANARLSSSRFQL